MLMKKKASHLLGERVYLPMVAARWNMKVIDTLSLLMYHATIFTILENVRREISFHDHLLERIKEIAIEQGKDIPEAKPEDEIFLRFPVLPEYLEIIVKDGYWEGQVIAHSFAGDEREEVFESAIVYDYKLGKKIKIAPKDLYVSSTDLLTLEKELGIIIGESSQPVRAKHPFLDTDHTFHAKNLKIAVEAWLALYEENPPDSTPKGGHNIVDPRNETVC